MRIHGLLCFYDEPVESLVECIAGLHRAGVDSIVAMDGAYALYPDAKDASHPNQHAAIHLACREYGMACTLHVPAEPWDGGEVEKRTALFALAWSLAAEGDWFWAQDADQVVTRVPVDLKECLAETECPTAEVEMFDLMAHQANQADWPDRYPIRSLYRAQPITVGPAHCNYTGADGLALWNGQDLEADGLTLDLTGCVEVEHRPQRRPQDRQMAKMQYYAERDAQGIERGTCQDCGEPSLRLVAVRWRKSRIGPVADWREACDECGNRREKEGRVRLLQLGFDPDHLSIENRMGRTPTGMTG